MINVFFVQFCYRAFVVFHVKFASSNFCIFTICNYFPSVKWKHITDETRLGNAILVNSLAEIHEKKKFILRRKNRPNIKSS